MGKAMTRHCLTSRGGIESKAWLPHPSIDRFSVYTKVPVVWKAEFAGAVADFLLAAVAFKRESR